MATKLGVIIADFETTLATLLDVGGTTATLQTATDDDGVSLPSGQYFFTIDGDNPDSSVKEHIVCTLSGTSLSSIKSVSRQGAQTTGAARKHRVGATVKITDFAHIRYINDLVSGATTFNASVPLGYDGTATISTSNQLATKAYVDGVAVAGAPDASTTVKGNVEIATGAELAAGTGTGGTGAVIVPAGSSFTNTSSGAGDANKVPVLGAAGALAHGFIDSAGTWSTVQSFTANNAQITTDADSANDAVRYSKAQTMVSQSEATGTSGEAFAIGAPLYLKASDGKLYKAQGTSDEATFSFVGCALTAAGGADVSVLYARPGGIVTGLSSFTAGAYYFITDTAGVLATTPGTRFARVAQALSTTSFRVIQPKFVVSGSQDVTSATTYVQTTGFYPASVTVLAATTATTTATGPIISTGTDYNKCIYSANRNTPSSATVSGVASYAFYIDDDTGAGSVTRGTITSKTSTGFTIDCSSYQVGATIYWTAFSE